MSIAARSRATSSSPPLPSRARIIARCAENRVTNSASAGSASESAAVSSERASAARPDARSGSALAATISARAAGLAVSSSASSSTPSAAGSPSRERALPSERSKCARSAEPGRSPSARRRYATADSGAPRASAIRPDSLSAASAQSSPTGSAASRLMRDRLGAGVGPGEQRRRPSVLRGADRRGDVEVDRGAQERMGEGRRPTVRQHACRDQRRKDCDGRVVVDARERAGETELAAVAEHGDGARQLRGRRVQPAEPRQHRGA